MDKIPFCFYFYLHDKLRERFKEELIDRKEACLFLRGWNIPKEFRQVILKEMELLEMVKVVSKYLIKIEDIDNPIKNRSKLYHDVGLW